MQIISPRVAIIAGACLAIIGSAMLSAGTSEAGHDSVAAIDHEMQSAHQEQVFTELHSAAALAQYCAHIGRVRKQKVMPCGPGAAHPCCTERQLQVQKMQGATQSFNWADPGTWSGQKGAAAQHLAHKHFASIQGMSAPAAAEGWQSTAPAGYSPQEQAPPQQQQQQLPGYYPHLLPGEPGVPEAGVQAPPTYQQPYQQAYQQPYQQEYQQPYQQPYQQAYQQPSPYGQQAPGYPQGGYPAPQQAYGTYVSPQQGPSGAQQEPQMQQAPPAPQGAPAQQFQYPKI